MTEPTGWERPKDEPYDAETVEPDLAADPAAEAGDVTDVVDAEVIEDAPEAPATPDAEVAEPVAAPEPADDPEAASSAPRRSFDLPEDLGGPAPATDFTTAVPEPAAPAWSAAAPDVPAAPAWSAAAPDVPAAPAAGGSYLDLPPLPEVAPAPPVPPPYAPAPTAGQAYGHGAQPATPPTWQQPAQAPSYPVANPGYQTAPVPYGLDTATASMAHWLPLVINVATGGVLGFLAPLVLMQTKGAQDPFVRANAVESLNLNLTVLVGYLASFLLLFVLIGFLTFPLIGLYQLIFQILGAIAANRGETYRYPFNIRFVK